MYPRNHFRNVSISLGSNFSGISPPKVTRQVDLIGSLSGPVTIPYHSADLPASLALEP